MAIIVKGEDAAKAKIRGYLALTLPECFIPELGEMKKGKVREIYFSGENVIMVTNDRVSAFDYILPNLIPFKGQVLNMISEWAFAQTKDIVPNALVENVDSSVVVQKQMKNLQVELIVRGYLWGSMAAAYEKGERTFCGLSVKDGLIRFEKFEVPIFTPTTKAEVGHDENMSMEDMEKLLGRELAYKARDTALKLFARGAERMRARGLMLIDTKYEFGVDEKGVLHVIDEVNTPDSSRMCAVEEYEAKCPMITAEMKTGKYPTVTELLKARPDLKLKEFSKQYIRDALLELGFDPTKDKEAPKLSEEQVVECAYRYICIYEQVTGNRFEFPGKIEPSKRVVMNLQRAGMLVGAIVIIIIASDADKAHAMAVQEELASFRIPSHLRSTAEVPPDVLVAEYNRSVEPVLFVTCPRGMDNLSGPISCASKHPVVACPMEGASQAPAEGAANGVVLRPGALARFAAQLFAHHCPRVASALQDSALNGDTHLQKKGRTT